MALANTRAACVVSRSASVSWASFSARPPRSTSSRHQSRVCFGGSLSSSLAALGSHCRRTSPSSTRSAHPQRTVVSAGLVKKLNSEQLEIELQDRSTPLIIDFFATWCGPCVALAKELEELQEELGEKVRVVKVDTDEEAELASQLQIRGLPTLVFVGTDMEKPALRTEGFFAKSAIMKIVENEL